MILQCKSLCQAKCAVCLGHVQRAMYNGFVYEYEEGQAFCREAELANYDEEIVQYDDWANEQFNNIAYANLSEEDMKSIDIDNQYK